MDELKQLDNNTLMLDNGSNGDQSDDKDLNAKNMLDQPNIDGILEGEPSATKDGSPNIDEDMTGLKNNSK